MSMYRHLSGICGRALIILVLILTFIFVNHNMSIVVMKQSTQCSQHNRSQSSVIHVETTTYKIDHMKDFCVFSQKCKIPRLDPFSADSMRLFKPVEFKECTTQPDLVTVRYDAQRRQYRLHINESLPELIPNISNYGCIYNEIFRGQTDSMVGTSKGIYFEQDSLVPQYIQAIVVECHELSNTSRILQRDAFALVQHPVDRNDKIDEERTRTHPNVILLGIDGMSQVNFQRTMPHTAEFVRQPGWYEMLGYNKVGDNTLPNILTLLTGRTARQWKYYCDVKKPGCLDSFTYVWDHYHSAGYLTAYAEDLSSIDTFHYFLYGFRRQPVDYYLHPFLQAIEQIMDKVEHFGYDYCVGRRQSYRYVLDYCQQMVQRFVQETPKPLFGLFWMNSFSHDDFSGPASVDKDFVSYLERYKMLGLFDRSIVMLLSDHGQRTGPLMDLPSSFLEERLPLLHIYLPPWYREQHPAVARALDMNRRRLSTPYDLHVTFKHVLQLVHPRLTFYEAPYCAACQSLLHILPQNRSCKAASIPVHWCCCEPYKQVPVTDKLQDLARLVVYRINQFLIKMNHEKQCYHLNLQKLLLAERRQFFNDKGQEVRSPNGLDYYRFKFTTKPNGGLFRATLSSSKDSTYVVIREEFITRLNSYRKDAYCVRDTASKKFCACLKYQALAAALTK